MNKMPCYNENSKWKYLICFCSILLNVISISFVTYKYYQRNTVYNPNRYTIESPYWKDKVAYYEYLNIEQKGNVFLVGDSMFDRLPLEKIFKDNRIRNRSIGYDNTSSLLFRLEKSVLSGDPSEIILFIGGNDLSKCVDVEKVIDNTEKIIQLIINKDIELYFVSLLPKGKHYLQSSKSIESINSDVSYFNRIMKIKCNKMGVKFVEITKYFVTDEFFLDTRITSDGIHLNTQGIVMLSNILTKYVK